MIELTKEKITVQHDSREWWACHGFDERAPGPAVIQSGDSVMLRDCTFYVDDLAPESAIIERSKASHRSGAAVVEARGYFPFGERLKFSQVCKYAQNHMRIAFDLRWPRRFEIKRHLGIGCLELPGNWTRIYVIPPARHLTEGAIPAWQPLPAPESSEVMVAHWHRPPLAVVFERKDGTRVEIGSGNDLWRWNASLGYGPESGSFKVFVAPRGVRFVREPLMCCTPFTPRSRLYRFKWYAAWQTAETPSRRAAPPGNCQTLEFDETGKLPAETDMEKATAYLLDFQNLPWPQSAYRAPSQAAFIRGHQDSLPCWQSNATRNLAKTVIRQIKERLKPKPLYLTGLTPAACWDPAHLDRNAPDGLPHWDMTDLLDFSVWTRRQFNDDWQLCHYTPTPPDLPSIAGLFQPNGFDIPN